MNSYSDACMALVADNIEKIYNFIEGKLGEEACNPLGFCPAEKVSVKSHNTKQILTISFKGNARFYSTAVERHQVRGQNDKERIALK